MNLLKQARARVDTVLLRRELELRYGLFLVEQIERAQPADRKTTLLPELKAKGWLETELFYGVYGTPSRRAAVDKIGELADRLAPAVALEYAHGVIDHLIRIQSAGGRLPGQRWHDALRQFETERGRTFVVSDVHLGIQPSAYDRFDDVLALCRRGDRLILLGDVLDFWIAGLDEKEEKETVRREWRRLFGLLAELHNDGVEIHYVPGNHDPFVFTLHTVDRMKWGEALSKRSAVVRGLAADLAKECRLTKVLTIHYPYLVLEIGGERWLFTHGHMHEWLWHLFTPSTAGLAESPSAWAGVTALATAFAHRYASQLRAGFLTKEALGGAEQWVSDAGVLITHRVIESLETARDALRARNWEGFANELELAFIDYTSANPDDPRVGPIRAGIEQLLASYRSRDLQEVSERERAWMKAHPNNFTFTCHVDDPRSDEIALEATELRHLGDYKHFVCGHFHQPRLLTGPPVLADSGMVLAGGYTALQINDDGWIGRPAFERAL